MDAKEESLEEIGRMVDKLENLLAMKEVRLRPEIHLAALWPNLEELKERIRKVYFDLGGEDVWSI